MGSPPFEVTAALNGNATPLCHDSFDRDVVELGAATHTKEQVQRYEDATTHTGDTTGVIRNNREGDGVLELRPESPAVGGSHRCGR